MADTNSNDSYAPGGSFEARLGWRLIQVKSRVDFSNQEELAQAIREARAQGCKKIALDLRANRFFSLPSIKICVDIAAELSGERGGDFALISCTEKTRRHFEIYGSLKHIRNVRSERDLEGYSGGPHQAAI
jgi:anti-anti-sigma regulatory factor